MIEREGKPDGQVPPVDSETALERDRRFRLACQRYARMRGGLKG